MTTNFCYIDSKGRPYGVGHPTDSKKPTHMINYTLAAILDGEEVPTDLVACPACGEEL